MTHPSKTFCTCAHDPDDTGPDHQLNRQRERTNDWAQIRDTIQNAGDQDLIDTLDRAIQQTRGVRGCRGIAEIRMSSEQRTIVHLAYWAGIRANNPVQRRMILSLMLERFRSGGFEQARLVQLKDVVLHAGQD